MAEKTPSTSLKTAAEPPKLRAGRSVHFVQEDGSHVEAIVIKVTGDAATLEVLPTNAKSYGKANVPQDPTGKTPGTWHFIEK
jgi:hypothetical protein